MGAFTALVQNGKGAGAAAAARPMLRLRLQRACAACAGKDDECESCQHAPMQRQAVAGGRAIVDAPGSSDASRPQGAPGADFTSGGRRVPGALRSHLEPLFGVRFDAVRLHDDPRSHDLARRYGARAFTLGQDVHFARGEFQPESRDGMALLAHELSHTVQQRGAPQPTAAAKSVAVDAPDSPLEAEADAAAARVLTGRPVAVRAGSAAGGISRLQRVPAAETMTREVDEHTRVAITRTVTQPDCIEEPYTESTDRSRIFYSDTDAHTVGMRASICNGSVRLDGRATVSYDELIQSGRTLLDTLRSNPAAGADIGSLLSNAINTSHVTADGEIELTVSGILSARVSGSATVGPSDQRYNVQGVLTVTPNGVSFRITGGIDVAQTPLQTTSTYTLEANATASFGAITLGYSQIDTAAVGGTPSTERTITGMLSVPVRDFGPFSGTTIEAGASADPSTNDFTPLIRLRTHFDGPARTRDVSCYTCNCPPVQIEYACRRTEDAQPHAVVDVTAGRDRQRLLYAYNSDAPADAAAFSAQVAAMAGQVRSGYRIEHIVGHASPEASRAYNLRLGQQRANHAHQALQAALSAAPGPASSAATLPPAESEGELLGESSAVAGGEASNAALVRELSARLSPLTEEQRLDLLGVDGAARSDPELRRQAVADVQAFIDGSDANGRRLGQRARWERIFPFLRRVDVDLVRDEQSHIEITPERTTPTCEPADLAWARSNESGFSPIPSADLLPNRRCRS